MAQESESRKSVYRFGADNGIWMGIYLTLISVCFLMSVRLPILSMLIFPLLLGVPAVLYVLLRKVVKSEPGYCRVPAMWVCGIWIFVFGSLICGLISALWIILFDPDFIQQYFRNSIAMMEQTNLKSAYASEIAQLKQALRSGTLPSPMEFVFTMIWSTSFFGSLLSLVVGWLICRIKLKKN